MVSMVSSSKDKSIVTGSKPQSPKIEAISVACPFPVRDKEPYKSTFTSFTCSKTFFPFNSSIHRCAARQGPKV